MTLKGGVLMAATSARRMTKDADLSTVGIANDQARVAEVVAEIVATPLDVDDGLVYDTYSIRTEVMREEAEYHGVRVKLQAHLSTARMTTTLDFSFGSPHRSVVVELPELLGDATIRLASYPPELTLAEKIATMMSRRELNTRDRDFADVWVLSRSLQLSAGDVRSAIFEVAAHRGHDVLPSPTRSPICPIGKPRTARCSPACPTNACHPRSGASYLTRSSRSSTRSSPAPKVT